MQNGIQATIHIELLADGNLRVVGNVPNMFMLNGMMETAKQLLAAQLIDKAKQKVVLPDPIPEGINLRM